MINNGKRVMAWLTKIDDIQKHHNADSLDIIKIGGWTLVDRCGLYSKGDWCVYVSIDSWVPHSIAPFLTKPDHSPKTYIDILGQRLRTIKLRGVISQGIILPVTVKEGFATINCLQDCPRLDLEDGLDVSDLLGIIKWEKPITDVRLRGLVRGNFPSFIFKTDQERVQNLSKILPVFDGKTFSITEKLHGTSCTVYVADDDSGVCSRNMNLKQTDDNVFWNVAVKYDLIGLAQKIKEKYGFNCALQGEIIGVGINGNMYNLSDHRFHLFDIFNIDKQKYVMPDTVIYIMKSICSDFESMMVPVIDTQFLFNGEIHTIDYLLNLVEVKSKLNNKAWIEGYVFRTNSDPYTSFKVVSNKFLMTSYGDDS